MVANCNSPQLSPFSFSATVRHPTGAGETKVLGRVFWRPIFTIENCLRNYWKLPSSFALIDVSLNSLTRKDVAVYEYVPFNIFFYLI